MRKKKSETKWGLLSSALIVAVIYLGLCYLIKPIQEPSPFEIYSEQR